MDDLRARREDFTLDLPISWGRVEWLDDVTRTGDMVTWICDGLEREETVLLACSTSLATRLIDTMRLDGLPVARLIGQGSVVMLPAAILVRAMTEDGDIQPHLYEDLLGAMLRRMVGSGPVRVLSEIADEAVRQLGPDGAVAAERAWSETLSGLDVSVLGLADLSVAAGRQPLGDIEIA